MSGGVQIIGLDEVIAKRNGSVDPSKFPGEIFELLSIPAFDSGHPEIIAGAEIGSTKQVVQEGDVLLSKIVPHIRRAWVVKPTTNYRLIASGEWIVFRDSRFDPGYLRHLLISEEFHRQFLQTVSGIGGSLMRARPAEVAKIKVPLAPKNEQRRIASILDKADSLRRKRQESMRLAETFLRAAYLDLAKRYSHRSPVESVLANIRNAARTGPFGSQLLVSEFTETGIPVLGIDNVVSNSFTWGARRFVSPEKYAELERYTVRPGDVMVTIMGTTGRVAIAPDDLPTCISTKHLCTLSLNQKKMRPSYLWACLRWDPEVRAQAKRESKGAIMEGWNMGIVKNLMVSEPPIEVQLKFEALLTQVEKFTMRASKAADETDAMIASLSSKYLSLPITV
ncbi:type I restriction enzyme S subunit [Duganella sp. 3397]|uniref:hypothetical protein n=1 Tax=Duganella sp. 3397 TaxID=2817732 RepID=UPI002855A6B3|nr:hypothetical protein [Duganella sp. 3397]MDR7052594.1 type I restriction enzyme S subunit [Duganella sp. 3397]